MSNSIYTKMLFAYSKKFCLSLGRFMPLLMNYTM